MSDLLETIQLFSNLSDLENFIYDNEIAFLAENKIDASEIIEVSFSSHSVRFTFLAQSGATVISGMSTNDFLNFVRKYDTDRFFL